MRQALFRVNETTEKLQRYFAVMGQLFCHLKFTEHKGSSQEAFESHTIFEKHLKVYNQNESGYEDVYLNSCHESMTKRFFFRVNCARHHYH